jgi:hypothetical protein
MKTPSQGLRRKRRPDSELTPEELAQRRREELYRQRHREKIRLRMRDWRNANRDKIKGYSKTLRDRKFAEATPKQVAQIRAAESEKTRKQQAKVKDEVYAAYGGYVCACCKETEVMFLSIDHIANNGAAERRSGAYRGGGSPFYAWLRKQGFPPGYQVLCMNCQVGKHRNKGVCPHQTRCND